MGRSVNRNLQVFWGFPPFQGCALPGIMGSFSEEGRLARGVRQPDGVAVELADLMVRHLEGFDRNVRGYHELLDR